MAEIISKPGKSSKGKRLSTRVDLTPMVDLGFLLITFFIFTTTLSEGTVLKVPLPDDRSVSDPSKTIGSKTISIILGAENKLWYYNGDSVRNFRPISYNAKGLREMIAQKRELVGRMFGDPKEMVVLIKSGNGASYGNLVNVLDEMIIGDVTRHVLMEPSKEELELTEGKLF